MPFNKKLVYIFLLVSFSYSLIVFNGIIDDFSPRHITAIEQISDNSFLDQNNRMTNQIPGFYALGVAIKLISNISSIGLLTYPLQLLPFLTIFYVFILKVSNSPFFSCAATFLYVCSGTTGTTKIFFWPHGVGYIVYYAALFSIFSIMLSPSYKRSEFNLLLIICGCSLGFLSYNLYSSLIILLSFFMLNMWIIQNKKISSISIAPISFLNCLLIFIVTQFGLSRFVYNTFIPTLKATSDLEISAVDKFLSAYIYTQPNPEISAISELLLNFPLIITIISALKYLIICISIAFFVLLCIKKISTKMKLTVFDLFIVSVLMSEFIYFLIRTYIGGISITSLFLPGIFCIIWLYQYSSKYQKWPKLAIIILLVLTPTYTYYIDLYNVRNQQLYENEYLKVSSNWYFENKGDNIGVSDEMSRNLISMFIYEEFHCLSEIKILPQEDAGFLVNKLSLENSQKYYLINYQLRRMSLQNWVIIKTWRFFENSIDSNKHICKIYDLNSLSIYYGRSE